MRLSDMRQNRRAPKLLAALALATTIGGGAVTLTFADALNSSSALAAPRTFEGAHSVESLPSSFADVVERVGPAVVNIQVSKTIEGMAGDGQQIPPGMQEFMERFFGENFSERFGGPGQGQTPPAHPRGKAMGVGSGFVIDSHGFIVTNNHVVEDAEDIQVTFDDGREMKATLVGTDPKTDLALIKVDAGDDLPYVAFGDSDKARVGDWVVAVGSPFGLGSTVTTGIISARGRAIGAGPYDDFLQVDASINRGNSGGPTFDIDGRVIGVNTAIFSPNGGSVGIGFAIPSNMAQNVIAQLKSKGVVDRGWLGVVIQNVTSDIAESLGVKATEGALVSQVTPDGPADHAGLQQGDVILQVNDEKIEQMRELPLVIAEIEPGSTVRLKILRDGSVSTRSVDLGLMPKSEEMASAEPAPQHNDEAAVGLGLSSLDPQMRQRFSVSEKTKGVLVTDVESGSIAAEKGFRPGDVIVKVANRAVSSPSDVKSAVDEARRANRKAVLFLVSREDRERFVAVPLGNA